MAICEFDDDVGGGGGAIKRGFTVFASSLQSRSQNKDWLSRNQDNVYD